MNKVKLSGLLLGIKNFFYEKLFKINDSAQKIALGLALGVFSGILPGTGPIAALFLAFVFKVNRASALLGSLLTNTWLSFVTFFLAIKIGSFIFKQDWHILQNEWNKLINNWHWQDVLRLSVSQVILPVLLGYLIISLFLGLLAYFVTIIILKNRRK